MITRRAAATSIAALAWTATSAQARVHTISLPEAGATIPMLDFGGRPVIEATIDGKGPYELIVDTGASVTVLDSALAQELGLRDTDAEVGELRVGSVTLAGLNVFVMSLAGLLRGDTAPRGVLSASAFPGHLFTIDYPRRQFRIRPGALPPAQAPNVFSYRGADLPSIPVRVAGREIVVHLDTGAPYVLALPTRYMTELPLAGEPVQRGTARTHSGSKPVYSATLAGDIAIGEFTLPTRELRFTDVVPHRLAQPKGQVGAEALREFTVTLDAKNERVRLDKL